MSKLPWTCAEEDFGMKKPTEYVRCVDMLLYVVVWSLREAMSNPRKKRKKRVK